MKKTLVKTNTAQNENHINNYVFHKGLDNLWAAIPRDQYVNYFNDYQCTGVIRSIELSTVISLANKVTLDSDYLSKIK